MTPAAFNSFALVAISLFTNLLNCAGVMFIAEVPSVASRAVTPGSASAWEKPARILLSTGCGMPDGPHSPNHNRNSKSGTPGADQYKVKGNIHWVSVKHAHGSEVRLYDRQFQAEHPEGVEHLNPGSMKKIRAQLEPSLRDAPPGAAMQFERHGYFVADRAGGVFNRTVTLRDSWAGRKP